MGALKPRTSFGALEVQRERGEVVVFLPLSDGTERLVFTLPEDEARVLARLITEAD